MGQPIAKIQAQTANTQIQIAQIKAAIEQAKIADEKELVLKELNLNAQQDQADTCPAAAPPPQNRER